MSEGVLVLDESLTPILANRAARELLGLDRVPEGPEARSDDVLALARRVLVDRNDAEDVIELRYPARTSVKVTASYLEREESVLLVVRDVSTEQAIQRARRQFVTHASHELKTPIAGIQALAEAVHEAAGEDPGKARHLADRLVQESERLSRLVGDLLDLSRVEDPGTIASTLVDLSGVAEGELVDANEPATAKGVSLEGDIADGVGVRGDASQLGLMIRNLLDNAVRYTEAGGNVYLGVSSDADDAIVKVTDDGIGIPLRHQARVFERFYRVDPGRTRERGGTGLGLAIVKHVADLHGGHVELTSQLGEGSTFTVRLPLAGHSVGNEPSFVDGSGA